MGTLLPECSPTKSEVRAVDSDVAKVAADHGIFHGILGVNDFTALN